MSAQSAFTVSVVGSQDDLARLHESAAAAAEPFELELTGLEHLGAIGDISPDVAVIGASVERPLPLARQIRLASPTSEILFLLSGERLERFRATLPFVPHLASAWTASDSSDARSLGKIVGEAARASRHRAAAATVLGRINRQIAARATQPAEVRRSQLVLSERYLATILTQSPDAFLAVDAGGAVIACNDAALLRFGPKVEGGNIADAEYLDSGDRERLLRLIRQAAEGKTLFEEIRLLGTDDEPAWVELSLAPVHDEDDVVASVSVTARDITERKRFERHLQLLIAELNHRVKNTLAIVQSLAHQTFTRDKPPAEAIEDYEGRLSALAVAHNLLTRQNWEAAAVRDVVTEALKPFCLGECWSLDGPDLKVPPRIAVSLTLALHELATNAQKYGSLSAAGGHVSVSWSVSPENELEMRWAESGGPPVGEPGSAGFGTRLLKRALAADLNGSVDMDFDPSGLVCRIRAPLPAIE